MSEGELTEENDERDAPPGPGITPELFRQWRSPRFGESNPERMNNPLWEWLVKSKPNAYQANERFDGPSPFEAGPCWCFDRFGQSSTALSDGRVVHIAGEHEDHYDPDFYIYNDVVMRHPDGRIDFFGYPRDVFPPTDFHSATLVGHEIVIIGSLGYPQDRQPGKTPVFLLDTQTLAIAPMRTSGPGPGWVHRHSAALSNDGGSILVTGGELDRGDEDGPHVENIDDWRLHLTDQRWERLTARPWQQWEILRKDRKRNHLWEIQQAVWSRSVGWRKDFQKRMNDLTQALGAPPQLDLVSELFSPSLPHEAIPKSEEEHNIFRISVEGVVVRYVLETYSIRITVEGELPPATVEALTAHLARLMETLENSAFDVRRL